MKKLVNILLICAGIVLFTGSVFANDNSNNDYHEIITKDRYKSYSLLIAQEDSNNNFKEKALLYEYEFKRKSPAGAWAMSFFIGFFVPVLGSGQYYAGTFKTAIPTTVLGLVSYGVMLGGILGEIPEMGAVGGSMYIALWFFDWIYAIIATKKYNNKLRYDLINSNALKLEPYLTVNRNRIIANRDFGFQREKYTNSMNFGITCYFN